MSASGSRLPPESFYKHCSSLEHAQLPAEDTVTKWRGRNPPHNRRADFALCDRLQTCKYGSKCPKAHSKEELREWLMRTVEEKEISNSMEAQGLMCYNEKILEEYKNSSNEVYIMSEHVDDVSISCDQDLTVECENIKTTLKWNFQVETEGELVHVALLKQEPGASFTLGEASPVSCIYSSGKKFHSGDTTYIITVSFSSINPGLYEQWLVLDFGMRPVLLKKLKVRVGQPSLDGTDQSTEIDRVTLKSSERWHLWNRIIIPCSSKKAEDEELLKEYKPPQISSLYKSSHNSHTPLNNDNYKERMHQFLYNEELAENQVVSRLNVCGEITTLEALFNLQSGMILAPPGELFCAASIPCNLTPDSPEGLVLKRSIHSALIAPFPSGGANSKVYEASIVPHKTNDNKIYLQLSKQCCSDLGLKNKESYQMEVQFQLDRLSFCAMHRAIDLLPDTSRVLPNLKNCAVPTSHIFFHNLNAKQQSAIGFITGTANVQKSVAPLLIYGPFGTGKTFTLATAASELCKHPQNKVLICTHTNSSADLYVSDHFHQFINKGNNALKPIRIKANIQGNALRATDKITLNYCFLSEDKQSFLPPTKAVLDRHNIVITTTTMARYLHDLQLKEGYFTHILIDEASQMLECEALMALGLAGPNTRVALAGDHMQMAPKLFSVDEHHRSDHTLLTRLFHYYQGQKCDAAQNSRIIFSENYRSTKEIVEFVSTHFYVGKNDVIKATRDIPAPPTGHALNFHHVRGECLLDPQSMSWYNIQEVFKVADIVNDILEQWPDTWGPKDQRSICILSEGLQVRQIRSELSKRRFGEVHVGTLANVQGKQFRAVILTTVQTRDSLTTLTPGMELFNDARVLNTAMTRAQSQVVVIGDAAALCCFGKCSEIWKIFINHCISTNSVTPRHFSKDFFEKDIAETARFQKCQHVDESNSTSDAILQELKDEYEQLQIEYTCDEDNSETEDFHQSRMSYSITDANADNLELHKKKSEMTSEQQGTLFRETYKNGYIRPFHNPRKRIPIKGTANLRLAFTGDEVDLRTGRVVNITKKAESARVLPCLLEDEDHSKPRQNSEDKIVTRLMIPLTKSEPKICIHINKKRRNFIPIWQQINGKWSFEKDVRLTENLKQNSIFMVQVIAWREDFYYPLGNVINILPIKASLAGGLMILDEEFKVAHNTWNSDHLLARLDEDEEHRKHLGKLTTFTVDPVGAKDLDDAISVRDIDSVQYELGIHIADVASFVSPGDPLDMDAKKRGATHYCGVEKPKFMFPQHLSTGRFSLLSGKDRRVVSLMFRIEKGSNLIIGEPTFQLSVINSNKQFSYEEAEDIISKKYKGSLKFDTVEDCVTVAYCFAKAQRRIRLADWAYSPCDDRIPGKRKAHLMIEELSVLFNKHAAETLNSSSRTRLHTPLRCQAEPDPEKVEEFKMACETLIPLSFHVRHRVDHDEQAPNCENFRILTEVWKDILSAAKTSDTDKMVDLVAADDIHPLLQLVINRFKKCSSKAYVIRSNSSSEADVGHYSLSLAYYTQATSPIRRYMDIILQRLLHSVICNKKVEYTLTEITNLCPQFEQNLKKAKDYEQKAEQISYAVSMKKQSATKLAFVVNADPAGDSFSVSLPFNKNIFAMSLAIMYKDLQLEDQPFYDETNDCITLEWKRRIYAADSMQMHQELSMTYSGSYIELPLKSWKAITEAIENGNLHHARCLILDANPKQTERQIILPQCSEEPEPQSEHWVVIHFQLKPGDTLQIQMTSKMKRGYHMPAVQLVRIKPNFEICVDHVSSPITCFSKSTDDPTRTYYSDTDEYVRIWKPLCEMESASTAVDQSDSIIIENLVVHFKKKSPDTLTGTFFLHPEWIEEWAIEFNLARCLLCIRKRGLKLTSPAEHCAVVDPREFIWVAHGVTRTANTRENEGSDVTFSVNHLPMEDIPESIFQENTCFTVEIIPKLLPDIRKENAVVSIPTACELVKSIALGQHIPKEVKAVEHGLRKDLIRGLPEPNQSQRHAVFTALNNPFTLIQGPPGTGKTVVGVHIVRHFLKLNSENVRIYDDPEDNEKKQIILYCGPSNKSVDVVAEYLMKLEDNPRPLRMYSQQVEMLDYPYPNCNLQFSQKTLRQERSKPELRSITLHHRMREKENPHSEEIKAFDQRIRLALEKKESLSTKEVKRYKKLLVTAREYELRRHDIVLCTCTQSSTPSLRKTVIARQILIDECAMATEPQAMIPLVSNKPEKIVLIGDHKQLRPIVKNERVRKLGMAKSLFERYYTLHKKRTVMLDTQYRMHDDIREFPSDEFYEGKLKTGEEQPSSILRVNDKTMPFVFGHITGKTISLVVSTAKGNENSKANKEERDQVVTIAEKLVKTGKIPQQSIVILSPYNAQVSEIRDELKRKKLDQIPVSTITKSQGSEWRYVIISTVVSLPSAEIESEPDRSWLSKHLGFVGDPNQINVAITRAKEGLCIIGNQELLRHRITWTHLLQHYNGHGAVTDADKISVCDGS